LVHFFYYINLCLLFSLTSETPSKTPDVPVRPEQPQPKGEQPAKAQPMVKAVEVQPKKAEGTLPTTGGQEENPYWMWIGGVVMLVGGLVAIRAYRSNKKQISRFGLKFSTAKGWRVKNEMYNGYELRNDR
jgi:LPXTG-motif cell wall-anchored protein